MARVFLSYSHKNEGFVEKFYHKLVKDGVDCFFDKESIQWGDNWVTELEKGLDESTDIILLLTPEFCESEWTKIERTGMMADDPGGLKKKLRPLLLEPCHEIPRFLKSIKYIDISTPEKFEDEYFLICSSLGGNVNLLYSVAFLSQEE